jgi:hypothetical protein
MFCNIVWSIRREQRVISSLSSSKSLNCSLYHENTYWTMQQPHLDIGNLPVDFPLRTNLLIIFLIKKIIFQFRTEYFVYFFIFQCLFYVSCPRSRIKSFRVCGTFFIVRCLFCFVAGVCVCVLRYVDCNCLIICRSFPWKYANSSLASFHYKHE